MQLVSLILILTMFLALSSGLIIFLGVERGHRLRGALYLLAMVCFSIMLLNRPGRLTEVILSVIWVIYVAYIVLMVKKSHRTMAARGWTLMLLTVGILGGIALLFSVVLPGVGVHVEWITPYIVGLMIVGDYFTVLKYEIISLKTIALKLWTYAVFFVVGVCGYMLIFVGIGVWLFHIEMTSDILALSFIMVVIVGVILPVVNEMYLKIRVFIATDKLDTVYLVKRLNKMAAQNVDLVELARTLARYMRFEYVGIIVGGKLYGSSSSVKLSREQMVELGLMEVEKDGVWMKVEGRMKSMLEERHIAKMAALRDAKGKIFGQMLVGRPRGKSEMLKVDLDEINTVVNLVASIVDSKEKIR